MKVPHSGRTRKGLGELLVEENLITSEQLENALEFQRRQGGTKWNPGKSRAGQSRGFSNSAQHSVKRAPNRFEET